jgi:hypothetical protein
MGEFEFIYPMKYIIIKDIYVKVLLRRCVTNSSTVYTLSTNFTSNCNISDMFEYVLRVFLKSLPFL